MLKTGDKAPVFTLMDKDGNEVSLSDFQGKRVVVYFYPKDNTPGCTKQACAFRDAYDGFKNDEIVVIGISKDSITSHKKFADEYGLPFILLSDPERVAIEAFGVWVEKTMYGKKSFGVSRSTFIIDENGIIIKVFEKANPGTNAAEILEFLEQ
jgi:peroxiredoxin Q/BCP